MPTYPCISQVLAFCFFLCYHLISMSHAVTLTLHVFPIIFSSGLDFSAGRVWNKESVENVAKLLHALVS